MHTYELSAFDILGPTAFDIPPIIVDGKEHPTVLGENYWELHIANWDLHYIKVTLLRVFPTLPIAAIGLTNKSIRVHCTEEFAWKQEFDALCRFFAQPYSGKPQTTKRYVLDITPQHVQEQLQKQGVDALVWSDQNVLHIALKEGDDDAVRGFTLQPTPYGAD